ncbi:hypothetical protein ID866_2239 [Astraeus odoratus]|nr:hypothetical protein ID866_2239 [Astraeus odoratus]
MFSTLDLFQSSPCPERSKCKRSNCLFSHNTDGSQLPLLVAEVNPAPRAPRPSPTSNTSRLDSPSTSSAVPVKRPHELSAPTSSRHDVASEPPRQRLRTATGSRPVIPSTTSQGTIGVPVLRVSAAQSQVAIPVRQAMLKSLYDHFAVLYEAILPSNPTLASEHALRQEDEIYKKSTKHTYRNAVINSIAALKKRATPTSASHPSVGTEGEVAARLESQQKLSELRLSRAVLQQLIMSTATMKQWGYVVEIPSGDGGGKPHANGQVKKCDRCGQSFAVRKDPKKDECRYHWGRVFTRNINGTARNCAFIRVARKAPARKGVHGDAMPSDGESTTDTADTALDVVALDCEMIYTTGGMRVARISVVDGTGTTIFDELIRMDDHVDVIDYNTRFSGITEESHQSASLTLSSARKSLDAFINSQTVIIGHALENDLKTMRMIHHQCIDTAILFPHRAGPPYRRSLRDLVKEHLGIEIQTGDGTSGHSSVEDSVATLDLVRWYVLNKVKTATPH